MRRLFIILPLGLATLTAGPATAEDLRDQILSGVADRTETRIDARETLPPGNRAEDRLTVIDTRLTARQDAGAVRLRPDIRLTRRETRIDERLTE